jgi:ABC-2 type transport system ATP-binding protein
MGKTIIISSHILSELQTLCNRCAIIEKGKLIYCGPVQGVRNETHAGRVFRVRVAGENSRALDLLRARVEIVEAMEEDGRLRVVVREDQADSGVIADVLVKNGTRLLEVREEELGLEEVFLRVTKGETQ